MLTDAYAILIKTWYFLMPITSFFSAHDIFLIISLTHIGYKILPFQIQIRIPFFLCIIHLNTSNTNSNLNIISFDPTWLVFDQMFYYGMYNVWTIVLKTLLTRKTPFKSTLLRCLPSQIIQYWLILKLIPRLKVIKITITYIFLIN